MHAPKQRDIGPGAGGGFFLVVVGAVAFICQLAALASKDGWWEMCRQVPCKAPSTPVDLTELIPCKNPDLVGLQMAFPSTNFDDVCKDVKSVECNAQRCQKAYDILARKTDHTLYIEEVTCLSQLNIPQSGYVPFGQICCNICNQGQYSDLEYVFRRWAADRQACGLFGCAVDGFLPQDDFCYTRAQHAEASQAFAILTCIFTGLLTFYHILGLMYQDGSKRQIPLPRAVSRLAVFLRRYMHWGHYWAALFSFLAGVLMIATLTEEMCGSRLSDYVESRFAVRIMWFVMTVQVICGSYYLLTVKGYMGLSKVALANSVINTNMREMEPPSTQEEITTPGPVVRQNSPQAGDEVPDEALDLHAIRMSPTEGAMEVDGPEAISIEAKNETEQKDPVAPPALS